LVAVYAPPCPLMPPYPARCIAPRFYFHCPGPPRALPAFPTRRSSDLSLFDALYPSGMQWYWKALYLDELTEGAIETAISFGKNIDRKSTRLNSSHVKISYAVFCLKKKKYYPTLRLRARKPGRAVHIID